MTRHKRNISARITMFYDDLKWKWNLHKDWFWCGFLFGVLCIVIVTILVLGV